MGLFQNKEVNLKDEFISELYERFKSSPLSIATTDDYEQADNVIKQSLENYITTLVFEDAFQTLKAEINQIDLAPYATNAKVQKYISQLQKKLDSEIKALQGEISRAKSELPEFKKFITKESLTDALSGQRNSLLSELKKYVHENSINSTGVSIMRSRWGKINGNISDQTDLQSALDAKQPLATVLTDTTAAFTAAQETKLAGIEAGAEVNVNADWNATSGDAQILNKPTIPDLSLAVLKADYTPAHSILVQQSGTGAPTALQIANNTLVGRLSGGGSEINDLSASDVRTLLSISNVDNTSDTNKPISTATQTALNAKQATLVSATNIKTINGVSVLGIGDMIVGASNNFDGGSPSTWSVGDPITFNGGSPADW